MNIVGRDSDTNSYAQGEYLGCKATWNETLFVQCESPIVKVSSKQSWQMLGQDGEKNEARSKYVVMQAKSKETNYAKINVLRVHKTVRPIAGQ